MMNMQKARSFVKTYLNYLVIGALLLVFALLSLTGNMSSGNLYLLEKIAIAIVLAISLSMVVGFLGELSLGHAGFMCVGAYVGGKISVLLVEALGNGILAVALSLLVGGIAAALFGVIIGLPALRLRGDYLAIVTLAFGEIVRTLVMNLPETLFGGTLGLESPRYDKKHLFIVGFVCVLLCLAVIQNLIKSKHGRAIKSIRDNEIAARTMGIDITRYKLFVFTVSSFFAGVAGVLYSYSNYRIQSANFDYNYSIEILVMVVLGGMGSINGSMVAAALITFLNVKLQTLLTGDLAVLQNLLYAAILIVIVIYKNAPGLKGFRERYNLKTLIQRLSGKKQLPEAAEESGKEDA